MKRRNFLKSISIGSSILATGGLLSFKQIKAKNHEAIAGDFFIGWAFVDITPNEPVLMRSPNIAHVSEGVMDPVTATALALESGFGPSSEKTVMISTDLCVISDGTREGIAGNLRDNVRKLIKECLPELDPEQIILNATHTHSAPAVWTRYYGVELDELDIMAPSDYLEFVSGRIAKAARQAWDNRKVGGISYGLGHAVVSHNRLAVDISGKSTMMFLSPGDKNFSHVEGYEDHSVNLLYTWDNKSNLTGVVINIASPSQVTGKIDNYMISADFWHDTRVELRNRIGKGIFILPQCSAAGDQGPEDFFKFDFKAEKRMQKLMFPGIETGGRGSIGRRKQIATRISGAVTSVLPYMKDNIEWDPVFAHKMEEVKLSRRLISMEDAYTAMQESEHHRERYEQLLHEIEENPEIKEEPRWYKDITGAYMRMNRAQIVKDRYDLQKIQPKLPVEVHVVRVGDIVMATNPFELYLDYSIRIKGRSPAIQTFLVQLAGGGTYLPTSRSIDGGGYGSEPRSTLIGPEGGQELVEKTLELINNVME